MEMDIDRNALDRHDATKALTKLMGHALTHVLGFPVMVQTIHVWVSPAVFDEYHAPRYTPPPTLPAPQAMLPLYADPALFDAPLDTEYDVLAVEDGRTRRDDDGAMPVRA